MDNLRPEMTAGALRAPKKHRFSYSIASIGIFAALLMFLIAVGVMCFISFYYQEQLRSQYLDYSVRIQTQINTDTATSFHTLERQLFMLGMYDSDISLINTTHDDQTFYRAKMALYDKMSNLWPPYQVIDGLFFYSSSADDYTPYVAHSASTECSVYIKNILTKDITPFSECFDNWKLVMLDGGMYLVRFVASGSGVMGAWASLPRLLDSFRQSLPEECVVCMLDEDHQLLQKDLFPDYRFEAAAEDHYQEYKAKDGATYIVNVYKTPYSDCYLALFAPVSLVDSRLLPIFRSGLVIALAIIAAVAVIALTLKRVIDIPLLPLKQAASLLQNGEKGTVHLSTDSHCREVQQLFSASNALLADIQALEARIYEEQLAQSRLELQFLKSQITPHFLINCLNAFSYLASSPDEADRAAAQRLTQTLSQHIRYSFVSAEMIPLSQEFEHLENYLELACIRYPGSLAYDLSLPTDCRTTKIPPMTLLTLCENSVKHNLIMGELLKIHISAESTEWKGNPAIHICYLDNGTGYQPDVLEHCNHILEHPEDVQDGHHIGIYNIVKATSLIYQEKAAFVFSNEPGAGARVDLYIPANKEESA